MSKLVSCILLTILLVSCKTINDDDYFFDKIISIENEYETVELNADPIIIEGYTTLYFSVFDSLMLFWNSRMPESSEYSISNIITGDHLGNYVIRGRGPHESTTEPIYQFYQTCEDFKTLLFAPNEDELREWNISKSIKIGHTVYDTIIPYTWRREHPSAYLNICRINEDELLVYIPQRRSSSHTLQAWPRYQLRSLKENKVIRNYEIFKQELYVGDPEKLAISPFYSNDCVKPDGRKIVQGMTSLSQINIIDLETGAVSYFRNVDTPDVTIFKKGISISKSLLFYLRCQCDDKFIYALYSGFTREDNYGKPILPRKIHQFDWSGNLIHEIILSEPATQIWLDRQDNLLYTYNEFDEHILRYNLNELDN